MSELPQLSRERIDWLEASGLTIAAASAEHRCVARSAPRCLRFSTVAVLA
jgi:hypothetical protein